MRTKIKAVTLFYVKSIPSLSKYIHINNLFLRLKMVEVVAVASNKFTSSQNLSSGFLYQDVKRSLDF